MILGGSRQVNPDPFAGYSDLDLYNQRRAALEHYDPLKTTEQITALLENIRPDEVRVFDGNSCIWIVH